MHIEEIIHSFPAQIATGIELGKAQQLTTPYRNIICCGMGGSAIAGEILSMVKENVIVHWDYDLPSSASGQDLVICTSWSGQTEETLSSLEKAKSLGIDTLFITKSLFPDHLDIPPRMAVGYMTGFLFGALGLADHLPAQLDLEGTQAQGRELASTINDRMPVIYSAYPWRRLTGFWKMAYSETAKRQVMVNWFPSGAHNEVVGWEGPYQKSVSFVLLRDSDESRHYRKNFDALLALLKQKEYTVTNVQLSGNTVLEKVFNNYILALWTAFFAAQAMGVDPLATQLLDEYKRLKA